MSATASNPFGISTIGPTGPTGPNGTRGITGATGATGATGITGTFDVTTAIATNGGICSYVSTYSTGTLGKTASNYLQVTGGTFTNFMKGGLVEIQGISQAYMIRQIESPTS